MENDLKSKNFVVGIKQSTKAVKEGRALKAIIAKDADKAVIEPLIELCRKESVTFESAESMLELGKMCGIDVLAAAAVIIK